jgi:transcriptional regulator GlxA family with amidase domain
METNSQTANNADFFRVNKNRVPLMVGILIFDHVEVLDVAGPFEVFSVTRLNEMRRFEDTSPFHVILIAESLDQIPAIGGLRLTPDVAFDGCPELDLLLVPGGLGTRKEVHNTALVKRILSKASRTRLTASVCTGSSLLGKAGLLDGRDATTHWRAFDFLSSCAPKANIKKDVQFTLNEPVFTSAGVAAGIDMALRIVSHFFGSKIGQATARHMEYPYPITARLRRDRQKQLSAFTFLIQTPWAQIFVHYGFN